MINRSAAILLALSAAAAHASVSNVSQSRLVRAAGTNSFNNDQRTTAAVGPWSESVEVRDLPDFNSGGRATQNTSISTTRFFGTGTAQANDDVQGTNGSARTSFEAVFDVAADTSYTFVGSWSTQFDFNAISPACSMIFERVSPSPVVFHQSAFVADFQSGFSITSGSANLAGTLTPGRYRIAVATGLGVGAPFGLFTGSNGFNIDLQVPSAGALPLLAFAAIARRSRRA